MLDVSAIKENSQARPLSGRRAPARTRPSRRAADLTKRRLYLKKEAFEGFTNAVYPGEPQCDIAARLGIDPVSWSLMRNGHRHLSDGAVAAILELHPELPLHSYATSVRVGGHR